MSQFSGNFCKCMLKIMVRLEILSDNKCKDMIWYDMHFMSVIEHKWVVMILQHYSMFSALWLHIHPQLCEIGKLLSTDNARRNTEYSWPEPVGVCRKWTCNLQWTAVTVLGIQDPIAWTLLTAGSQRWNFHAFQLLAPITARQVDTGGGDSSILTVSLSLSLTYTHSQSQMHILLLTFVSCFTFVFSPLFLHLHTRLADFTPPPACSHSSLLSLLPLPMLYCTHTLFPHSIFSGSHTDIVLLTCFFHSLFYSLLYALPLHSCLCLTHATDFSLILYFLCSLCLFFSFQFGFDWPLYGDFFFVKCKNWPSQKKNLMHSNFI